MSRPNISTTVSTQSTPAFRRRLQYSLRGLGIVVTIFALWLGFHAHSAHKQHAARRTIQDSGGQVLVDYQISGSAQPWVPAILANFLGEDLFATVVRINFPQGYPKD